MSHGGTISRREHKRRRDKIVYPNRISCLNIDYACRFPELTTKIMNKLLKEM